MTKNNNSDKLEFDDNVNVGKFVMNTITTNSDPYDVFGMHLNY